jgi:hypothetical protein
MSSEENLTPDAVRALIAEAEAHIERAADSMPPGSVRRSMLRGEGADDRLSLLVRLTAALDSLFVKHDSSTEGWEYATTDGPRKSWDGGEPPEGDGWEQDYSRGDVGQAWERFDYHEERYWRRWIGEGPKPEPDAEPYVDAQGNRYSVGGSRVVAYAPRHYPMSYMPRASPPKP